MVRLMQRKKIKNVYKIASMAEWSKAVDLSPTISGCAGSNPAWRIFFYIHINNNFRAIINYLTNFILFMRISI